MSRLSILHLTAIFTLVCLYSNAQWNEVDKGKFHKLFVSNANKQVAIYKGLPSEIRMESFKNKELKLTSSNATIKQNSANSYTIISSDNAAMVEIFSVKKSKMKLLAKVSIPAIDVPTPTEMSLNENEIIVSYNLADFLRSDYSMSPYDSTLVKEKFEVESWNIDFKSTQNSPNSVFKSFNGTGNKLSNEVIDYMRYLTDDVDYIVRANFSNSNVEKVFRITNPQQPAAKYVILNNTPQNKPFFDEKDPYSFISMLNNNYGLEPDISQGIFSYSKSNSTDGSFVGPVKDGLDWERLNSGNFDLIKNSYNLKLIQTKGQIFDKMVLDESGNAVFVYHKKGTSNSYQVKSYLGNDPMIELLDPKTETIDPSDAELDAAGLPSTVESQTILIDFAYTSEKIDQIIIRYDSVANVFNGAIETQPSRISLARKFGKNELADVVFSMKIKDLVRFESYAPLKHVKNDKENASYFNLENPNSLLGYLNSTLKSQLSLWSFPYLSGNPNTNFGELCDPKGKVDSKLVETEVEQGGEFDKMALDPTTGAVLPVYHKKGASTDIKVYTEQNRYDADVIDPKTETFNVTEAEQDAYGNPMVVTCRVDMVTKRQFKGLTDLFINRKYLYDPTFGVYVAKPVTIGFAQQFQGQTKPTLIMELGLDLDPKLMSMLPKMQPQLFLGQPWALSLLQNDVETNGEIIRATDITALQKKFQFRRKMVTLEGDMELSNEPHF
jgi:hypothetical protein